MGSNTEAGKAFQLLCRDALKRVLGREFDLEVPIEIGGAKPHAFDLATHERDIVAECKAYKFTVTGNNPSAKITALREAATYLRSIRGNVTRLLIIKQDLHPRRGETLAGYFVRLNLHLLQDVTVLEMPESGGELTCVHGSLDPNHDGRERRERSDEIRDTPPQTGLEPAPENGRNDPFSPTREPAKTSIDLAEGQRGVSYQRLFTPYLRGANRVRVVDPYIRYDYQIRNFINFCEFIAHERRDIELALVTGADSPAHEVELSAKFDQLKASLVKDRISFKYKIERGIHDRFIEADTGWRIVLGRGLDIYQKPETRFGLGLSDQTKRPCKATTITFTESSY